MATTLLKDVPVQQVALRWLLQKDFVTSIVISVKDADELEESMKTLTEFQLSIDEVMHFSSFFYFFRKLQYFNDFHFFFVVVFVVVKDVSTRQGVVDLCAASIFADVRVWPQNHIQHTGSDQFRSNTVDGSNDRIERSNV